jgi:hypothetical protein
MPFLTKDKVEKPLQEFCSYACESARDGIFDDYTGNGKAYDKAVEMTQLMNKVLDIALYIDEWQTVWTDVSPTTSHRDPFDALREALAEAEKLAMKGY